MLPLAPAAEASCYPSGACTTFRGCALDENGDRVNVRVFLAYLNRAGDRVVVQRNRLGALNGSFSTHWTVPTNSRGGLQRIIVRILTDQGIQPHQHPFSDWVMTARSFTICRGLPS